MRLKTVLEVMTSYASPFRRSEETMMSEFVVFGLHNHYNNEIHFSETINWCQEKSQRKMSNFNMLEKIPRWAYSLKTGGVKNMEVKAKCATLQDFREHVN